VETDGGTGRPKMLEHEKKAQRSNLVWAHRRLRLVAVALAVGIYLWCSSTTDHVFLFVICSLSSTSTFEPASTQDGDAGPETVDRTHREGGARALRRRHRLHAGALLGDVRHDPYRQADSRPRPTPRGIGAIHRAHNGVLFIDEINVLRLPSQQALLTALQEGKYAIAVSPNPPQAPWSRRRPCPAVHLVAAGNLDAVQTPDESVTGETGMHPALRSRIRGYGYECS